MSLEGLLAVVDPVAVAYDGGGASGVLMMCVALRRDGKVCRRVSQGKLSVKRVIRKTNVQMQNQGGVHRSEAMPGTFDSAPLRVIG